MEQNERRALDRCFSDILSDLDPTLPFLHSLYADGILTGELREKIGKEKTREMKVAKLMQALPQRGPKAFTVFKYKLKKDYPWLSKKMSDELHKLVNTQASIDPTLLITVIERKLVPLIYPDTSSVDMCNPRDNPTVIIQNLSDLLTNLERQCHISLGIARARTTPLHKLIERKLSDNIKAVNSNREDLSKQVRDLQKQLKKDVKLKGENEKLKQTVQKQKDKLKDHTQITREANRYKQDMEKYKLEANMLKMERDLLREQLQSQITDPFARMR